MKDIIWSVESECNNYADDQFSSHTLADCITYVKENLYGDENDYQIAHISVDEQGCFDYCYSILNKEEINQIIIMEGEAK